MSYLDALLRKVLRINGGTPLVERKTWNFVSGATAVDNPATGETDITIASSPSLAETLTNKTITAASNTITDTAAALGDLLRFNGTRFVRLARGTNTQVLTATATDIGWAAASGGGASTGATGALQESNGAGGFAATGTGTLSASLAVGTTPATTGIVRTPNAQYITQRNAANSANIVLCGTDSSNNCDLGGRWVGSLNADQTFVNAASFVYTRIAGSTVCIAGASSVSFVQPILGYSTPYGVHGTVVSAMTDANYVVPSSEYSYDQIVVTTVLTAGRTFKLPTPASEATSYTQCVANESGQTITISRADGAGTTYALSTGSMVWFVVRPAGVKIKASQVAV